jgi:hypothetical protein
MSGKVISKHPLKMFFKRDSDLVNISQKSSYIVEQIINPTEIKSNKTNAFNLRIIFMLVFRPAVKINFL